MISIRESNTNIEQIFKEHITCVKPYVETVINFYIDIFELFPSIQRSKISEKEVIDGILTIKRDNNCGQYKSLLKPILISGAKLKNDTDLVQFRNQDKFIPRAKEYKKILQSLKNLKLNYEKILKLDFDKDQIKNIKKYENWQEEYSIINFLLKSIFDYDGWFNKIPTMSSWGPYQLAKKLNIRTCPYCNRHYTFSLADENGKKMGRPDFDHFMPKTLHPLLALSFYNLIPSCKDCNGPSMKSDKPVSYDTHLNPYELNLRNSLMRFTYYPETYEASIGMDENMKIRLKYAGDFSNTRLKSKIEGNIKLFALDEIYKEHTDIVQEIIRKRVMSNDKYIEIIQNTFKNFSIGIEEAYKLAYGTYYNEGDFYKRPISKLTKDIAIEMGTIISFKKK